LVGSESGWCAHLPAGSDAMEICPVESRIELPVHHQRWLPQLMKQAGPAGRAIWLLHEPPITIPIATPQTFNPEWTEAVERYQPLVVISGHDHQTPRRSKTWHAKLGNTVCVNVGQANSTLHYCLIDCEFRYHDQKLPERIIVRAFPWNEDTEIVPG
jgi:hypothetical protein